MSVSLSVTAGVGCNAGPLAPLASSDSAFCSFCENRRLENDCNIEEWKSYIHKQPDSRFQFQKEMD